MDDVEARQRLDKAMTLRRKVIRKKWGDIATEAGMKYQSLHRLRTNPEVGLTDLAIAGIEDAMGWPHGVVADVTAGTLTPESAAALPVQQRRASPPDPRFTDAGYLAAILDEHAEQYGEEVLHEAWRLRESKKDLT